MSSCSSTTTKSSVTQQASVCSTASIDRLELPELSDVLEFSALERRLLRIGWSRPWNRLLLLFLWLSTQENDSDGRRVLLLGTSLIGCVGQSEIQ